RRRADAGHGLEQRLRELVHRRDGAQLDAVARLDVALPPARRALRRGAVRAGAPARAGPGRGMSARVIITGAAGGIGTAATAELRRRGARVVGLDLHASGDDVIACDVRDQASVDRAVAEAIARLGGGVDVLVNNAGLGHAQSAGSAPDDRALA